MLGPPGAGKGTQARRLGEDLAFPSVSTGEMFREELRNQTELGKRAQAYMESGRLVPDEVVDAMVKSRLSRKDCALGFILDGYPRTIQQAEFLQALLVDERAKILTIGIHVEDDILVDRLAARLSCPNCGKMFNAKFSPSKTGDKCDACGTPLVLRKDDSPEVVRERLSIYRQQTKPLIQFYKDTGSYVEVKGDDPADAIFGHIVRIVKLTRDPGGARAK